MVPPLDSFFLFVGVRVLRVEGWGKASCGCVGR